MFFVCVLAVPPPLPGVQLRLRSGHVSFKSIPEEPTEGDKVEEVAKEMGEVISGLAEFKTELLQLHAMVRRGEEVGWCDRISLLFHLSHNLPYSPSCCGTLMV